jgi:regulator of protease activity HflC (stomatin/prohibitin superfamily)
MNQTMIIAAILMVLGAGVAGYVKGRADNEARHVALDLSRAKAAAEAARLLAAAEQEARLLARELEDRAYADPVAVPVCLSADRVRRLNLR